MIKYIFLLWTKGLEIISLSIFNIFFIFPDLISTTINFPLLADINNSSKFNKNLLLFCAIGERSTLATQVIKSYDIFNSYHLIGGIKEWIKKEMPIQI